MYIYGEIKYKETRKDAGVGKRGKERGQKRW